MKISGWLSNRLKISTLGVYVLFLFGICACNSPAPTVDDNYEFALQHIDDLRLSTYITAHTVDRTLSTEAGKREAISLLRANGITKVYLEVYRGGLVVDTNLLAELTKYFQENGFEVVGGIATVPGGDFGVKQEGQLGWFNWQNPKTQNDLKQVMLDVAPIFNTFIVDDFLCTGDTSLESKDAKGDKSWSAYRRQLLTELASTVFIEPAKSVNPDLHMIIKYPQWYDRFHMFGYDVESGPRLFDEVWVGTETRGQYTQRFGFVQPYEGFANYRWLSSLSKDKIGGAWFDHGDCDQVDFIEQAYQSVLAGASELGMDLEKLFRLAKAVKSSPVAGIPGYKPPHSDAGGDLYIMDFMGMLGIPLIPVSSYPDNAKTIFLPTQAASDPDIISKVGSSLEQGVRIIMTAGFLANIKDNGKLASQSGISMPIVEPQVADVVLVDVAETTLKQPLALEAMFEVSDAEIVLEAKVGEKIIPFMTKSSDAQIYVLNTHTFSEEDFEAVGEVLLCPRPLGLVELPKSWANTIREVFNSKMDISLDAPTRVTMQPLQNGQLVLHNYNQHEIELTIGGLKDAAHLDLFTDEVIEVQSGEVHIKMPARSRIWLGN
jgi:hypothetical protein